MLNEEVKLKNQIWNLERKRSSYEALKGNLNATVAELRNAIGSIVSADGNVNGGVSGTARTKALKNNNDVKASIESKIAKITGTHIPTIDAKLKNINWELNDLKRKLKNLENDTKLLK